MLCVQAGSLHYETRSVSEVRPVQRATEPLMPPPARPEIRRGALQCFRTAIKCAPSLTYVYVIQGARRC